MNEFIYTGSAFEQNFKIGSDQRWTTFKMALNILHHEAILRPVKILESGCQRLRDDWGGGQSTRLFGNYLHNYPWMLGSKLVSVDISMQNLEMAKQILQQEYPEHTRKTWSYEQFESDSVVFLENCQEKFDLIYLDSFDADLYNREITKAAQTHQLHEAELCVGKLFNEDAKYKILLLDDNALPFGGKCSYTKNFLAGTGWTCLFDHQQSLWIQAN